MGAGCRCAPAEIVRAVSRLKAFAGALALVLVQPAMALGAPPAFHPVYRPAPATSARERSAAQPSFNVPFNFKFHSASQEFNPQATFNPLRWRRWQWESLPPFLPLQSGCATGALAPPWSPTGAAGVSAPPSEFTIGSLVDDRSRKLFSSPTSYAQDLAASNTGGPETSGPLTVQYGFQSVPCGASDFFNF